MSKYTELIYKNLERLIEEKKSSGRKISEIAGKSSSWFSAQKNAKKIDFDMLEKICEHFQVPVSYFFEDNENEIQKASDRRKKKLKELSRLYQEPESWTEDMPAYRKKPDYPEDFEGLTEMTFQLLQRLESLETKLDACLSKKANPTKATKDK